MILPSANSLGCSGHQEIGLLLRIEVEPPAVGVAKAHFTHIVTQNPAVCLQCP